MTAVPDQPRARFKPTRAGIINLWDYLDEEFVFADGRLALRGHNGSGKTKALEVLFPFILDGSLDARRLDPFSGENRTMKANLLFRGQDSEHGYAWMEFARPGEVVTLVIGMSVHKHQERPRLSFYVTGMRMGADFGLLSADSRPLTAKQLTALLGRDAYFGDRKGAYHEAVDARLFGLGRTRYVQLLDLLIALRRPLLAKDLDPAKVSDTLTAGLSPVDDELIEQAARDFENLAAVQKQYDDLTAADSAVRSFLDHYVAYLRAHARDQLDRMVRRMAATAGQAGAIVAASRDSARALHARDSAAQARDDARVAASTLDARVFALKNRDAYLDHEKLGLRREQLDKDRRALTAEQDRLVSAQANVAELSGEAEEVAAALAGAEAAIGRLGSVLAETAEAAGLARDGEPADSGADLTVTAKAKAARRRDDIGEIRAAIASVRDAERDRVGAHTALGKEQLALDGHEQALALAEEGLGEARAEVTARLAEWGSRWSGGEPPAVLAAGQFGLLAQALDRLAEPEVPTLTELLTELTKDHAVGLITRAEQLRSADRDLAGQQEALAGQRAAVAGEHDDAPPASDLRPADRTGRPGAPLWQLVDFAGDLQDGPAAALEGALYGAGLLTAWIHPDPALTDRALAAAEADGYLAPLPPRARPAGRTLADLLVPEDQDMVGPEVVAAVLRSIAVTDELPSGAADHEASGQRSPVVTLRAQYSYGPHSGALPKPAPEFIGATNRASRRLARLAEIDRHLAEVAALRDDVAIRSAEVRSAQDDLAAAQAELPKTTLVTEAIMKVANAAVTVSAARDRLAEAREALDKTIAELDARIRRLRYAGADRDMPTELAAVDAVERAVAEFERAAADLVRTRESQAGLRRDLAGRQARIIRQAAENADAAGQLGENQAAWAAAQEKLSVDERASGAEYEQIRDEISAAEQELREVRARQSAADKNARDEHDCYVRAQNDLDHGRTDLVGALAELSAQAAMFGPYAHSDLRPLLGVPEAAPWPAAARWPAAEQAATGIVDWLAGQEVAPDPDEVVRSALPGDAAAILDAFAEALKGGRAVTEGVLKNALDRMWSAYHEFENALKAGEDGYQADLSADAPFIVEVMTNEGRVPAATFARKIAEHVESQGILLEDRERTVLEDSLLTALAQQVHDRVVAAKDLVRQMDQDTRSKPMSSGMAIGIGWVRSDKLTQDQGTVSRLLDRDADSLGADGLAGLRGMLRSMIRAHRAANPRDTYREVLGAVLDYRSWYTFELRMLRSGGVSERLTRKKHSEMSGGEKSAAIHMPLFAAANALYSSSKPACPRLVALDEAFAGIDDKFKPELLGLTVRFDLDLFMTGHDLWVTFPTVPAIAHYDLEHDKAGHTVSALLAVWDGGQLIDAGAGYAGNEDLAADLLDFRPTRHVPGDAGNVLALHIGDEEEDQEEDDT